MGFLLNGVSGISTGELAIEWPMVGTPIWVSLPCCPQSVHPTRVEDWTGDTLIFTTPIRPHTEQVPPPPPGEEFSIGWKLGSTSTRVPVRILWESNGPKKVWAVKAIGHLELVERREHIRYEWIQDAEIHLPSDPIPLQGRILDISEGGVRCEVPDSMDPDIQDCIGITFDLWGKQMLMTAQVAWWQRPSNGKRLIGLQFITPGDDTIKYLREHTMALEFERRMNEIKSRQR